MDKIKLGALSEIERKTNKRGKNVKATEIELFFPFIIDDVVAM